MVLSARREWSLVCPKGDLGLVFPNGSGKVELYSNLIERGFDPIQVAAGIVDEAGAARSMACTLYVMPVPLCGLRTCLSPRISVKMGQSSSPRRGMDMKPSRFTEEQIIGILREQEAGAKTPRQPAPCTASPAAAAHRDRRHNTEGGLDRVDPGADERRAADGRAARRLCPSRRHCQPSRRSR